MREHVSERLHQYTLKSASLVLTIDAHMTLRTVCSVYDRHTALAKGSDNTVYVLDAKTSLKRPIVLLSRET